MPEFPRGFTIASRVVAPGNTTAAAAQVAIPGAAGVAPVITDIEAQLWTPRWTGIGSQSTSVAISWARAAIPSVIHCVTSLNYHFGVYQINSPWGGSGVILSPEVSDGASVLISEGVVTWLPAYNAASINYPYLGSAEWLGEAMGTPGNAMTFSVGALSSSFAGNHQIDGNGFDVTSRSPVLQFSPDNGTTLVPLATLQTPDYSTASYSGALPGAVNDQALVQFDSLVAPNQVQQLTVQGYYI